MKLERVDALASRAVYEEFGRVTICQAGQCDDVGGAECRAVARQRWRMPERALALDGRRDRGVARVEVVMLERRDLIDDFMRSRRGLRLHDGCLPSFSRWASRFGGAFEVCRVAAKSRANRTAPVFELRNARRHAAATLPQ